MSKKLKKIPLQAGCCDARWTCKNVDKEVCNPLPKEGRDFVECEHYEMKIRRVL